MLFQKTPGYWQTEETYVTSRVTSNLVVNLSETQNRFLGICTPNHEGCENHNRVTLKQVHRAVQFTLRIVLTRVDGLLGSLGEKRNNVETTLVQGRLYRAQQGKQNTEKMQNCLETKYSVLTSDVVLGY